MPAALLAFAVSAGLSSCFVHVPALRRLFTRRAGGPRWRADPIPLAGGLAMAAGFTVAVAVLGRSADGARAVLAAGGTGLLVGLADDFRPLPPLVKLVGQAGAGLVLAAAGVRLALPGPLAVAWTATVLWVVVVANALNLFDNVDAAAGGASLIGAVALWLWWTIGSGPSALPAALAGAAAGFLALNLPPARLFMGDAGSHFLGAALAGLTALDRGRAGSAAAAPAALVVLVPMVLLAVPLCDAVLVAVERARHGRPITAGGRDHTSHRLLLIGFGVRPTVAVLWATAVVAAGAASLAAAGWGWFAVGAALLGVGLTAVGIRLARVPVYG
jgi:UDP-GlcNAc:undecaprenyl-phosphate GlcNAc-1-phosphate transferase